MSFIRNLLATIGLVALVAVGAGAFAVNDFLSRLDPEALRVYSEVGKRFLQDLDPGTALVRVERVKAGMTPEDVVESLKSLAVQNNLLFVGEAPFYKQVEAVTGKPYRFVSFYSFCDAGVGAQMIEYNSAYSAFMPCRIAVAEDKNGRLWLHMMSLDFFIHGGKPLPPDLKAGAIKVRDALDKIMQGAASGEF